MNFYHYSIEPFDQIKSKILQEANKTIEPPNSDDDGHDLAYMKELLMFQKSHAPEAFDYRRSVSMFLEPIPRNLASIFNGEHQFWKPGIELWEYTIDSRDLPKKIPFKLHESPEVIDLIYNKQDWDSAKENPKLVEKYSNDIDRLMFELGLSGEGIAHMEVAARKYNRGIEKYYREAYELHKKYPEDKILQKYASCVPHFMIYPGVQFISYKERQQIKLK